MASTTTNYGFPYPEDADPVDVAGDLQALADDIDSKLSEAVADTVGGMVTSNTENGISVTYDDNDNTLDFDVADFDITLLGDVSGSASIVNLASASVNVSIIDDSHNHSSSTITDFAEAVADTVGNMVTSNTENGITVEYDDNDNTLDFDVADFDIVLSGDVSGSATVTNLASINISASVADNSHNHVASNITDFESAVEAVTEAFVTIDLPSGTDPVATIYNDTLTISESNGILVSGSGSNTVDISTNATPLNTASALVSRSADKTFDISGIDFDVSASPSAVSPGTLYWNSEEGTLDLGMNSDVIQSVGMEFYMPPVKNDSGEDIPNGSFVMATGAQGDRITIAKAVTDGSVAPEYMIGIATHTIPNGAEDGLITTNGIVRDIDTSDWSVGTVLYPNSASAGALSASVGIAPEIRTPIAIVLRQHQNTGRIYVRMNNAHKFGEEQDVKLTSLADNDVAVYDSGQSLWINTDISTLVNSASVINAQNLVVSGDLTVSGSTTYINTTELLIEDNLVTLNSGTSGSPSLNAGIEIDRGDLTNTALRWNETSDVWQFTNDGSTYYDLVDFDTAFAAKTTDDLTEGSNEYFTTEKAQDAAASMITGGTHTNITVSYDDEANTLNFSGTATITQEQVQDDVAPLFTHSNHTNITATYDDDNNEIILVGSAEGGGGGSAVATNVGLSNSWWLGV